MSTTVRPRKSISELKRPDLKGQYFCVTCGQNFQHAASLNRHRAKLHSAENTCLICNEVIRSTETIRQHLHNHGKEHVFTCGCCNWSFESKKLMADHTQSMRALGVPGETKAIAVSNHAPGSLLQSAIQGAAFPFVQKTPKTPKTPKTARRNVRSSLSASSSSSRSSSPPSGTTTDDLVMPKLEPIDLDWNLPIKEEDLDFTEILSKLSALVVPDAPYIESFDDAVIYIFSSTKFTDSQIASPIVWQHIVDIATSLSDH